MRPTDTDPTNESATPDDVAAVVRRYLELAADLSAPPEGLRDLLHPDLRVIEHPNALNPHGTRRNRDQALAAYATGKQLLSSQQIDLHELIVSGARVAARVTWRGTLARDVGSRAAGTAISAEVAGFLTVADSMIIDHETFDCYTDA